MIKGIIFDYGGTLDSRGVHWSEVIWQGYQHAEIPATREEFRDAYVQGERRLARERIVLPGDNFEVTMRKKVAAELDAITGTAAQATAAQREQWAAAVAGYCYRAAAECIDEARPVLEMLSHRYPMMVVSNFYGNIDEVLRDYGIRHFFRGIIESAVVGVRKPNPTLYRLGIDALELEPDEVLVVGDSLDKDILPAESLGCQTLWLKGKGWNATDDTATHPGTITRITQVLDQC